MDLETLKAELAAATERLTALEAKLQAAEGERDAAKATADAAESKRADAEASVLARAAVRAQLLTTADRFGVKDATDKSDRDVRVAVIAAVDGVQIAADKADEYVSAWFDSAIQRSEASRGSFRALKITQDKAPQSTTELAAKYNRYAKKETK
jgi:hypothetical protein